MGVLRLELPTDPRWVNIVEKNIEEILTDHAWCEQKAATNAITIITNNSEHEDLVTDLLALAKEELTSMAGPTTAASSWAVADWVMPRQAE